MAACGRAKSDSGRREVLESPELLSHVLRALIAADVARCACVNRQWRLCAKEVARRSHWLVQIQPPNRVSGRLGNGQTFEPMEVENLWMHDLDAGRGHLVPIQIQPEWECRPVWSKGWRGEVLCSYEGLLVIRLSYRCGYQVIIGDPLKNRWFRVPGVPFTVWLAAIWPGTSPLLVVSGWEGRVATYSFEKECWTLGDELDFQYGQLVRSGDALYMKAYEADDEDFPVLLRFRPAKGDMRWEKVEAWKPGKRSGELDMLDDELSVDSTSSFSFFEHTEGSGEVLPPVYVEKWHLLHGTDEPVEDIRGAHAVYEAQGGKLVRSAWFDDAISSEFCSQMETAFGGNWCDYLCQAQGSSDALFWCLSLGGALTVIVYDRLEKRWKQAIVEDRGYPRVVYFVASTSSEHGVDYLRSKL